jgi:glycerol uptake facilitator-like aquaporin
MYVDIDYHCKQKVVRTENVLLLQAAVVADRNAKLSVFATRPAIYSPLFNFITETMGTVALILLALLIELQVITWVHVHFCA